MVGGELGGGAAEVDGAAEMPVVGDSCGDGCMLAHVGEVGGMSTQADSTRVGIWGTS